MYVCMYVVSIYLSIYRKRRQDHEEDLRIEDEKAGELMRLSTGWCSKSVHCAQWLLSGETEPGSAGDDGVVTSDGIGSRRSSSANMLLQIIAGR